MKTETDPTLLDEMCLALTFGVAVTLTIAAASVLYGLIGLLIG